MEKRKVWRIPVTAYIEIEAADEEKRDALFEFGWGRDLAYSGVARSSGPFGNEGHGDIFIVATSPAQEVGSATKRA